MVVGRPKRIKVKIADLLRYLSDLPETHPTRLKLTEDKMLVIRRYVEELQYLEGTLARLKQDLHEYGEIELFTQGKQVLRRANPALDSYFSTLRAYRQLVSRINDLIYGVTVW